MNRPTMASRRPLERGEFSWVSLLLLLVAVSAVYLGYVWAPVYMLHLEVKQVVRDFMNQAVHQRDDDYLVRRMCDRLRSLDSRTRGESDEPPAVDVDPHDVTWERDADVRPPMLHVAFEYTRLITYPILDRTQEVTMGVEFTQDIGVPVWNK